jgi:sodium transport system permease protein
MSDMKTRPTLGSVSSPFRRFTRLARKELRESLRDKRTLVTLIMMPLIVYPLLGSVVQKFALSKIDPKAPAAVVVLDEQLPQQFYQTLKSDGVGESEEVGAGKPAEGAPAAETPSNPAGASSELNALTQQVLSGQNPISPGEGAIRLDPRLKPSEIPWEVCIQDGIADVGIRVIPESGDPSSPEYQFGTIEILCREGDPFSTKAAAEVEKRLRDVRDDIVRGNLLRFGGDTSVMPRMNRVTLSATGPKESPLSAFVPLMLVLMTMTGAVYPAIDLTAGERERGTLEMLIAAPVSRRSLLTAKFVAVFTVAVLTAMINLVAMLLTIYGTGFDKVILGDSATLGTFLQVLSLLVVFASFFSAVLLGITSFARSFREAQAWLIPLMLVSLAPGILSLMPGVRLTFGLSLIPLVNIVLLGKELFQGIASPLLFVVTLLATLAYTILALRIAATVFGSDTVLFGGASAVRKQQTEFSERLTSRVAIMSLLILTPAFIVLAGLRGKLVAPENLSGQLVLSGVMTIALFAVLPSLLAVWQKVRISSVMAIREFSIVSLIGAMLLGATAWTLAYEVLIFAKGTSGWASLLSNPKLQELARRLTSETPLLLRLITLALIPAVCEEFFFRGFLMNALLVSKDRWKGPLFLTSFLFAAFHVIVDQSMTFERFPATFLLGLILGWIRIQSGSLFPGIAMHVLNNGLLLSLTNLQPLLLKLGLNLDVTDESHLPLGFLVICSVLALLGTWLVWLGRSRAA